VKLLQGYFGDENVVIGFTYFPPDGSNVYSTGDDDFSVTCRRNMTNIVK
jgi:hypothetical protein